MSEALNLRAVMKGVQCVCGQWWPDYVMRGGLAHMECCGSVYEVRPATSGVVLSLRDGGRLGDGEILRLGDSESDGLPISSSHGLMVSSSEKGGGL